MFFIATFETEELTIEELNNFIDEVETLGEKYGIDISIDEGE